MKQEDDTSDMEVSQTNNQQPPPPPPAAVGLIGIKNSKIKAGIKTGLRVRTKTDPGRRPIIIHMVPKDEMLVEPAPPPPPSRQHLQVLDERRLFKEAR